MPLYTYSNPDNPEETIDILQSMSEDHVYFRNGIQWDRVWHSPQVAIDTKIDPNSHRQWMDKTNKTGTVGDLLDRSAELSERRAAERGGIDPVKVKSEEEYSRKRKGRKRPTKIQDLNITI